MTFSEAESLLRKWQKILKLQDWDIELKFCKPYEIHKNHQAENQFNDSVRESTIVIIDPKYNWPGFIHEDKIVPMERTIIHELLHLVVAEEMTNKEYEVAIESLAKSFYTLGGSND